MRSRAWVRGPASILCFASLAAQQGSPALSGISFLHGRRDFPAGEMPVSAVAGDFNRDGIPDLAVSDFGSGSISILIANGRGGFLPTTEFPAGSRPNHIVTADFNRDGKLDLAISTDTDGTVSVFSGNGDGTFMAPLRFPAGNTPNYVAVGDFNGDHIHDVITADLAGETVSVLPGNGDGTFGAPIVTAVGSAPMSIAVGDFNEDGRKDIVLGNARTGGASLLLGRGDGTFGRPRFVDGDIETIQLAVGDFNGDGHLDIAVPRATSVGVSLGRGDGTFQLVQRSIQVAAGLVMAADFNGDGKLDLAVAQTVGHAGGVSMFLGRGDGTFPCCSQPVFSVASGPGTILAADFNGDRILDLASANGLANNVSLLFGTGDGTFHRPPAFPVTPFPVDAAVADFNRDGRPDVAVADSGNTVSILLAGTEGAFAPAVNLATFLSPNGIKACDFNRDGRMDLVVADSASHALYFLPGDGAGGFGSQQAIPLGNFFPFRVSAGDFNGHGNLDVVTLLNDAQRNVFLAVLPGNGNGTFQAPRPLNVPVRPQSPYAIGDFNGDGKLDIAVNGPTNTIWVMLGNGNGTFGAALSAATAIHADSLTAADLNHDGKTDLIASGKVTWALIANGNGTFQPAKIYEGGTFAAVDDIDGDGNPDLLMASDRTDSLAVLLGNGAGAFSSAGHFAAGMDPIWIGVADFNGDHKKDVIAVNHYSSDVTLLINTGP